MLKDFVKNIGYDDPLEVYLSKLEGLLKSEYKISKRAVSLLLLQEDEEIFELVKNGEKERIDSISDIVREAKSHYSHPLNYIISERRQKESSRITASVMSVKERRIFNVLRPL